MQKNIASAQPASSYHWFTIVFMLAAHILAAIGLFMPSKPGLIAFGILYVVTTLGITLGFHRFFTHRSFKVPRWVSNIFALMGTLALQGSIDQWVAHHRMHHSGSDTPKDPHNARRGFWFSHMAWMMYFVPAVDDENVIKKFSRDISADPFLRWLSRPSVVIGIQIVLGAALYWLGGIETMMWGIWVRLVAAYHATWLVNSAAHLYGYKNYEVSDLATNNWVVAILAMGEGWHNNHHAYSDSARHGHKWWEFDITWTVIRALKGLGLASEIKLPPHLIRDNLEIRPLRTEAATGK